MSQVCTVFIILCASYLPLFLQLTLHPSPLFSSALEADLLCVRHSKRSSPSLGLPVCGVGRLAGEWGQRYLFSWLLAARIPRLALALTSQGGPCYSTPGSGSCPHPASLQASWALTYLAPCSTHTFIISSLVICIKWAWVILAWALGPDNTSLLC